MNTDDADRDDAARDDAEQALPSWFGAADPVLADAVPERGSCRNLSILERAMSDSDSDSVEVPSARRRRRRWLVPAVAAAAVVILAAAFAVVRPFGGTPPATAAERVTSAADNMADLETFRVEGNYAEVGSVLHGEVAGRDSRSVFTSDDGTGASSSLITTVVGDHEWQTVDGKTTEVPSRGPEGRNAPFQEASPKVIHAAMRGSQVAEVGQETVRGIDTTHYRIILTKGSVTALAALAPNVLSAFELEHPSDVASIDLWIASDLVRRIHVRGIAKNYEVPGSPGEYQPLNSTIEFYDFGAAITIRPPDRD